MKFAALVLSAIAATSTAKTARSRKNKISKAELAQKLVQQSRRLNQEEEELDLSWAVDYSVKYQGCHHIKQWNEEADGQEDVRIFTKRLVRFRLCPSDTCSASSAGGCQSGYGDYIVDMDTYLQMYWEAREQDNEMSCNNFLAEYCNEDNMACGDDQDNDVCEYQCALNYGREDCIEGGDPNQDDQNEQEEFEVDEFFECRQIDAADDENGNNQYNQNQNNNGEEIEYFAGPYCSEQGGAIKIGVFLDDQCSEFAGVSLEKLTGIYLKYTDESIVEEECTACIEMEEYDQEAQYNNNNNNNQDEEEVEPREFCQMLYMQSGKCESYMGDVLGDKINEQACNYMNGIKMVRSDGLLDVSDARPSAVATAFIVIFAMAFAAMAFYVWYLRTRLGVKKTSLL